MDRNEAKIIAKSQLANYLQQRGIDTSKPFHCLKPGHDDQDPSMRYDDQRQIIHCFSCGVSYDIFDVVGIDYGLSQAREKFNKTYEVLGIPVDSSLPGNARPRPGKTQPIKKEQLQDYTTQFQCWHAATKNCDYLQRRGISEEIQGRFQIGYCAAWKSPSSPGMKPKPVIIIPTSKHSYITRSVNPSEPKQFRFMKVGDTQLFNREALYNERNKPAFIVEGEIDALSIMEAGGESAALGSTSNIQKLIEACKEKRPTAPLVLCLDSDEAGKTAADKLGGLLEELHIPFLVKQIPGEIGKDPNDYLLKDRAGLAAFIRDAEQECIGLWRQAGLAYINPLQDEAARKRYPFNDMGIGLLFADMLKPVCRYCPEVKEWYCYTGVSWTEDTGGMRAKELIKEGARYLNSLYYDIKSDDLQEKYRALANKLMGARYRKTILEEAQSVYPLHLNEMDQNSDLFNCKNGTLHLLDGTFSPHQPDDMISKQSGVTYDPEAVCERWIRFIDEIMEGDTEKAKFLQKAFGYALLGNPSLECLFILDGMTTRNGKGTCVETIMQIFGDYGKKAQPETVAVKSNPNSGNASEDKARLCGARFVSISEPPAGMKMNEAIVKQMTGNDTINARFLHKNSFDYKPVFVIFIDTNHRIIISDDTIFSSGRIKTIPFNRHFEPEEQDHTLKQYFAQPENQSGIFNWVLEGMRMYLAEGMQEPESVIRCTAEYRKQSDLIELFLEDCVQEAAQPDYRLPVKEMYAVYKNWCVDNGYCSLGNRNFIENLKRKGYTTMKTNIGQVVVGYNVRSSTADLCQIS